MHERRERIRLLDSAESWDTTGNPTIGGGVPVEIIRSQPYEKVLRRVGD